MTARPAKIEPQQDHRIPGIAFCMSRVPGSQRIVYGSSDFNVYDVDLDQDKPEAAVYTGAVHASYVTGLARTGPFAVTGSYDGNLVWWDIEQRKSVRSVAAHSKWIRKVVASPDGQVICSVADDMVCRIWDAYTGQLLHELHGHAPETPHHYPSMLYVCTISADSRLLATGDKVGHVVVWELQTGQQLSELEAPGLYTWDPRQRRHSIGGIRSLQFSPDNKLLAVGGIGQIGNIDHLGGKARIEIFEWESGKRLHEIESDKFKGLVERMEFASDGSWLCAAGGDHNGFVSFYEVTSGKPFIEEKAPMHVQDFEFNRSQDRLYLAGFQKLVWFKLQTASAEDATEESGEKPVAAS